VQRCEAVIRNLKASAEARTTESARLAGLAKRDGRNADALKGYLKTQMDRAGIRRVDSTLGGVSIRVNSRPAIRWLGAPEWVLSPGFSIGFTGVRGSFSLSQGPMMTQANSYRDWCAKQAGMREGLCREGYLQCEDDQDDECDE